MLCVKLMQIQVGFEYFFCVIWHLHCFVSGHQSLTDTDDTLSRFYLYCVGQSGSKPFQPSYLHW